MICALVDYIYYRRQTGPYSLDKGNNIMRAAFIGTLPEPVVKALKPGNVILHADFDWVVSWLIMYLTKSQVSHASLYAGNAMVLHTGLGGVRYERIENIFGEKTRLLPLVFRDSDKAIPPFNETALRGKENLPYPVGLVIRKALRIASGRNGRFYSLRLFADSLLVVLLLAWAISFLSFYMAIGLVVAFLILISVNLLLSFYKPLPFGAEHGAPCDALVELRFLTPLCNPASTWLRREIERARG